MSFRVVFAAMALVGLLLNAVPAMAAVHAGDELIVTVYDHPELSGPLAVDSTDHVTLPLVGAVDVHGLSTKEIALRVQQALRTYLRQPAVDVQLKTQVPLVFIDGGPGGTLKYDPGETLVAALGNLAPRLLDLQIKDVGMTTDNASTFSDLQRSRVDLRHVSLIRDEQPVGTYDATQLFAQGKGGPVLQAGDTLAFVNKPNAITVRGEVARPGVAYLWDDEPLSDALSQAGGLLTTASTGHIVLRHDGVSQVLTQGDHRWNDPGNNGDTVVINAAPRINIVGAAERPGAVVLKNNDTLVSALYEAGGPNTWADLRHVQVINGGQATTYDITKLIHGDTTQNPELADGAVVMIPEGHKLGIATLFSNVLSAAGLVLQRFPVPVYTAK